MILLRRSRLRTAEALLALAAAGAVRRALPMRRWAGLLGTLGPAPADLPRTRPAPGPERDVAVALHAADLRLPWPTTCLDRATAGQLMLRRRRRPATLVIGLDPLDPAGIPHAWLVSSAAVLVGGGVADRYVATTAFTTAPASSRTT